MSTMRTKWAHLAGTTTYRVSVFIKTPLDDPEASGNMGLEGFDEDFFGDVDAPTEAAAKRLVPQIVSDALAKLPLNAEVIHAKITEVAWEAEEIPDDEYGVIHSAEQHDVAVRYGYPAARGRWTWDAERSSLL